MGKNLKVVTETYAPYKTPDNPTTSETHQYAFRATVSPFRRNSQMDDPTITINAADVIATGSMRVTLLCGAVRHYSISV